MSDLGHLAGASAVIGKLTDDEFAKYWAALGTVARIASVASDRTEQPARTEISNVAASTERKWAPHQDAPASPRAIGFGR